MLKHIWKIIWNERRHNIGLWLELTVVAVALWYIADHVYVTLNNYFKPLGFDIEDTYIMRLGLINPNSAEYVNDIPQETRVEQLGTALERIRRKRTRCSVMARPRIDVRNGDSKKSGKIVSTSMCIAVTPTQGDPRAGQ